MLLVAWLCLIWWLHNREGATSELGTDARHEQQRSAGRAHRFGRRRDGQHVMEIWRRGRRQHLVAQHRGLVRDAVFHWQPVQRPQ